MVKNCLFSKITFLEIKSYRATDLPLSIQIRFASVHYNLLAKFIWRFCWFWASFGERSIELIDALKKRWRLKFPFDDQLMLPSIPTETTFSEESNSRSFDSIVEWISFLLPFLQFYSLNNKEAAQNNLAEQHPTKENGFAPDRINETSSCIFMAPAKFRLRLTTFGAILNRFFQRTDIGTK